MSRDVVVTSEKVGFLQDVSIGPHRFLADEPFEYAGCDGVSASQILAARAANEARIKEDLMTHDTYDLGQIDGNTYKSSQAAESALKAAILRAEIARSYEEFLEIFDELYADDAAVASEDSPETIRGKERVPFSVEFSGAASRNGRSCRTVDRYLLRSTACRCTTRPLLDFVLQG